MWKTKGGLKLWLKFGHILKVLCNIRALNQNLKRELFINTDIFQNCKTLSGFKSLDLSVEKTSLLTKDF